MQIQKTNNQPSFQRIKGIMLEGAYKHPWQRENVERAINSIRSNKIFEDIFEKHDGYIILDKVKKTYDPYSAGVAHEYINSLSITFDMKLGFWGRLCQAGRKPMSFKLIELSDYECFWDGIKRNEHLEDDFNREIRTYSAEQLDDFTKRHAGPKKTGKNTLEYEY